MHSTSARKESGEGPSGNAYFVKVVASDHTSLEIPRKVKVHAIVRSHLRCEFPRIVGSGKWLLNYARNANKHIPVEVCDYDEKAECAETIVADDVAQPCNEPSKKEKD
jgi:hypothetical protein